MVSLACKLQTEVWASCCSLQFASVQSAHQYEKWFALKNAKPSLSGDYSCKIACLQCQFQLLSVYSLILMFVRRPYKPAILTVLSYNAISLWMKSESFTIQMKVIQQQFALMQYIMTRINESACQSTIPALHSGKMGDRDTFGSSPSITRQLSSLVSPTTYFLSYSVVAVNQKKGLQDHTPSAINFLNSHKPYALLLGSVLLRQGEMTF